MQYVLPVAAGGHSAFKFFHIPGIKVKSAPRCHSNRHRNKQFETFSPLKWLHVLQKLFTAADEGIQPEEKRK